jgi:hypothetical protein
VRLGVHVNHFESGYQDDEDVPDQETEEEKET